MSFDEDWSIQPARSARHLPPHLTQRPSCADCPAAIAMMRAMRPSSPEQGDGLSFTRQSQNARVSWMYAWMDAGWIDG